MKNIFCPACGHNEIILCGVFRAQHKIFSNSSRVSCKNCELVFINPMPSDEDLLNYNSSYFDMAHGGLTVSTIEKSFFDGIAQLRLSHLRKFLQRHHATFNRVLELGPGPGYFAKNWLNLMPSINYSAIETDRESQKKLENLGVKIVDLSDETISDVVVMCHVLEHVSNPVNFIDKATRGLGSRGVLFIEVPCQDWIHKDLDEPHILFFDKKSMRMMLEKLGFDDIEIAYYGIPIGHLRNKSNLKFFLMRIRSKLLQYGLVFPFSSTRKGMEDLADPLTRAIVAPFKAHVESTDPAWWLRVLARKI